MYTRTRFSFSHLHAKRGLLAIAPRKPLEFGEIPAAADCAAGALSGRGSYRESLHSLHQLVNIPTVLGTDWYGIWNTVQQVEFLDTDGVDFVEDVDDGDVTTALGLEDVDEVVNGGVASDGDIGRVDTVFVHDRLDLVVVDVR